MKIAILGCNGMLGSMVRTVFSADGYDIVALDREHVDAQTATVTDWEKALAGCDYVINCIGIIKPYIHDDHMGEVKRAIEVNSLFPIKLDAAAERIGARVIQIATDCVYDGQRGRYVETDKHNAIDVYGKTKSLGEVVSPRFLNLRCSIIGPEKHNKFSFLEWFLTQPDNATISGYQNHFWNGVTTLTFAKLCRGLIRNRGFFPGFQHVVPADMMSKAAMLRVFADVFNRRDIHISDTDAPERIDRTLSTIHPTINQRLWQMAGYDTIPTVADMIHELKQ